VVATLQSRPTQIRQPSLLPGWTVGHVATHIARNAEGHSECSTAAMRDEIARCTRAERAAHCRHRGRRATSATGIAADVADTAACLEAVWEAMPSDAWGRRGITIAGEESMADLVFIRWREAEVHHADLGLGYAWSDWDREYVRLDLVRLGMLWASRKPMGMTGLPSEAMSVSDHHRLAWLLGRADIEGLAPAGIMG
jgi:maleylpyruvate isomerase